MRTINKQKYKDMLLTGKNNLENYRQYVNDLNVFPVPDGDTGTNMCMTIASGAEAIEKKQQDSITAIAKDFSKGLLMGARGNSGVITSQIFRGIGQGLEGAEEIDSQIFAKSLTLGSEAAYKSVIKPVEGTILTVIKDMAIAGEEIKSSEQDLIKFLEQVIRRGKISLENTPNLLPVLKEAGVVDSGGQGLIYIFEGMLEGLKGNKIKINENVDFDAYIKNEEHSMNPDEIQFSFCTEMLVELKEPHAFDKNLFIEKIESLGDSIVAITDENILKCHIHTEDPTLIFKMGFELGRIITLKSENMKIQAEEAQKNSHEKLISEKKEQGIVAVSSGQGITNLFQKIIPHISIVEGGQTLNPSIEDLVSAARKTNAEKVLILPNNSNIILAAEGAAKILAEEGIDACIVPTKFMTQALECLLIYDEEISLAENFIEMQTLIQDMKNIEVTRAIRDTEIGGVVVHKDDKLILNNGQLVASSKDLLQILREVLKANISEDTEVVNIIKGAEANDDIISSIEEIINNIDNFIDVNIHEGDQPVYPYLISII